MDVDVVLVGHGANLGTVRRKDVAVVEGNRLGKNIFPYDHQTRSIGRNGMVRSVISLSFLDAVLC